MDCSCQLYNTASPGRLIKLDSIYREGTRIYTSTFRTLPVESFHTETYDPHLELRRSEVGMRFLYRLRSSTTYTESLNTLDDRED